MADGFNNRPGNNALGNLGDNLASNFSGILSVRPTAKYASGARTILKINDKVCGFAFGVSWKITTMYQEIRTVDDYLPYELAPQAVSVEGSLSCLSIPGQSPTVEGWQPDVLSFLFQRYVSIEVRDSATDQVLFATRRALITSKSEDIRVDQLNNVTLTWKAIGWIDERVPKGIPEGADKAAPGNGAVKPAPSSLIDKAGDLVKKINPFG
jgi:hypothetical protein